MSDYEEPASITPKAPPLPLGRVCHKCGMANPNEARRCSNCGAWIAPTPEPMGQSVMGVVFVLVGLPVLFMGGCFIYVGTSQMPQDYLGIGPVFVGIGVLFLTLFGLLAKLTFFNDGRRRK